MSGVRFLSLSLKHTHTHHGLSSGVIRAEEIGGVFFLESNATAKRVIFIILKDAAGGVVDQEKVVLLAHICESESAYHIGSNGVDFVTLAPVNIRTSCHPCSIEHMRGLDSSYVLFYLCSVL